MKEIKGKITITRTASNRRDDFISIYIGDANSGLRIMEIEIELEQFALLITGLARQDCNIEIYDNYGKIGKKKVTKNVWCKRVCEKGLQRKIVLEDYKQYKDEWEIWDDGTSTQQNAKDHHYILCKYVEEK